MEIIISQPFVIWKDIHPHGSCERDSFFVFTVIVMGISLIFRARPNAYSGVKRLEGQLQGWWEGKVQSEDINLNLSSEKNVSITIIHDCVACYHA